MSESPYIIDVTAENFRLEVLERSQQVPVLVDFWAAWCGPCKMLLPVVTKLAQEYGGQFILAKVNIDEQQALATQFGVRSVPTVKLVRGGRIVDEFMGVQPEAEIRRILERHIERESDRVLKKALELAADGAVDDAYAVVEALLAQEPENYPAQLVKVDLLLQRGEAEAASVLLESLPADIRTEPEAEGLAARVTFARATQDAADPADLRKRLTADAGDSEARYQLGSLLVQAGDYEGALEQFLELMRRDRGYGDDAGRKGLLQVFELLGGEGPLVSAYRRKMAAAMY